MFRFEKLEVWQRAIEFANHVYDASSGFPADERYGMTSQIRRAAVSVSSNIAEGSGRASDNEFARFLEISYGSLMEVVSQARIALLRTFLKSESHGVLYQQAEELARMLSGLRSSLQRPNPTSNS